MEDIELKYGDGKVSINLDGASSVEFLTENEMPEITDLKAALLAAINEDVIDSAPLKDLIAPDDKVTIVISDITRFWMRQDKVLAILVEYMHDEMKIPYDNMVVLVALGSHRAADEEELCKLASKEVYDKVKVVNHDCDADDLVNIGTTSRGTEVWVNPLAVGRKTIMIGGTVHHIMAGYGGGRKSVLPGISGRQTIRQNHTRALDPEAPKTDARVGGGKITMNPINEDMDEAAALLAPTFGINIVVNTSSKHSGLFCGNFHNAWLKSCEFCQKGYGKPIDYEADIVIASCGGFPKDINLYQATKTIFNATRAVKKGGTVIFLAECREGGGAKDFFSWMEPLKRGTLDEDLRKAFTIGGYIFYAACEVIRKCDLKMLSIIDKDVVRDMNIDSYDNMEELLKGVDFNGKSVYVIPYGGSVMPQLKDEFNAINSEFQK
ncbi:MAG: nickel-dependent lactate racemase [Clostridium sp.]|nr:nickel-dependent lactate racemase [Clostridium sp.]